VVFLLSILYFVSPYLQSLFNGYQYHLFTMVLFALLLACLSVKPIIILENKVMNYLGTISYGIYMYHYIVMNFIGFFFLKIISPSVFSDEVFIVLFMLLVFGLTILVSHFSFKYYESYFLKKKNKL